ncbi:MAG TPA: alpha/beta hydrolase [Gemmataceae bacterium]|nr:alpha/beta hydrolase [Gemmataceae bacterium]
MILMPILLTAALAAAESDKPKVEPLWPKGAPGAKGTEDADKPTLTVFLPPADKANGCAVVICPGGGYGVVVDTYEGKDVARWLNEQGVAAFVLRYRHAPRYRHPAPLQDAQRALRTVRARADEWKVDSRRVGIMGFSAGGHLASTAGTHFDDGKPDADDPVEKAGCRPDFLILAYPVITLREPHAHKGSRDNLLGDKPSEELLTSLCNDEQVTAKTPPTFLFHTSEDAAVPPENSVLFYLALRRHKVPAELHVYEKGRHGVGLATGAGGTPNDPVLTTWKEHLADWMKGRGLLKK